MKFFLREITFLCSSGHVRGGHFLWLNLQDFIGTEVILFTLPFWRTPKYLRAAVCSDWRWGALPRVCHILGRAGMRSAKLICLSSFLHHVTCWLWYVESLPYLGRSLQRPKTFSWRPPSGMDSRLYLSYLIPWVWLGKLYIWGLGLISLNLFI